VPPVVGPDVGLIPVTVGLTLMSEPATEQLDWPTSTVLAPPVSVMAMALTVMELMPWAELATCWFRTTEETPGTVMA
jgi:hypothetical protein